MFSALSSARRNSSQFALAIALATGAAIVTTAAPTAAYAQDLEDPSNGFRTIYAEVVPLLQAETADFEAARGMIPRLTAAIENNRDRDLAGNVLINIGSNVSDRQLQRQGIVLRLQSGLVTPDQVGLLNWYAGNFALEAEDYTGARTFLDAALAAGFSEDGVDLTRMISRTYSEAGDDRGAFDYLSNAIAQASAAGHTAPETWLRSNLQYSYENDMVPEALALTLQLIDDYPTASSWSDGLRIMSQTLLVSEDAQVDLFRLMSVKGALIDRSDMITYIEAIDPRLMSNEVLSVLQLGVAGGVFESTDPYYAEVRGIAQSRAAIDRSGISGLIAEGRSGDALDAMNAGDVLFSLGNYDQAPEMYQLGLERGFDANTANTRIGINHAMSGNYAAALAALALVEGERAPIAALWAKYAEQQSAAM